MERLSKEVDLPIYSDLFTDSLAKEGKPGDRLLLFHQSFVNFI
jgi:hypothetical protein